MNDPNLPLFNEMSASQETNDGNDSLTTSTEVVYACDWDSLDLTTPVSQEAKPAVVVSASVSDASVSDAAVGEIASEQPVAVSTDSETVAIEPVVMAPVAAESVASEPVAVVTASTEGGLDTTAAQTSVAEVPVGQTLAVESPAIIVAEQIVDEQHVDEQHVERLAATPVAPSEIHAAVADEPALTVDVVDEVVNAVATDIPQAAIPETQVIESIAAVAPIAKAPVVAAKIAIAETLALEPQDELLEAHVELDLLTNPKKKSKFKNEDQEPSFADFALRAEVQAAIVKSGYDVPTAIQTQIIPLMLEGRDVLAQSQTGTGKTAAFALPILSRIDPKLLKPQVIVLAPTRELAIQVSKSFSTYGACLPDFSVLPIYGGSDYDTQFRQLKRGVQVVVGTPGRVIDHVNRGTLDLSEIKCLVLDEADEMLNMGFLEDVQFVLEKTPSHRQVALFSATLPAPIRTIAQQYLNNPAKITIKKKTMTADSIRQRAVFVNPRDKVDVLTRILESEEADGVIVFTKTREASVTVAEQLIHAGLSAVALNGDMPQKTRERTIEQLKSGQLDILVATDVAARGLDVTRISHVFNFDLPNDGESYIHRVGRTGRAGRKGEAIIFLTKTQRHKLRLIERATNQPIEVVQPPSTRDINALRTKRFKQRIANVAKEQNLDSFTKLIEECAAETGLPMLSIAAALAHIGQNGNSFMMADRPKPKFEEREERFEGRERNGNRPGAGRGSRDRNESGPLGAFGNQGSRHSGSKPEYRVGPPEAGMQRYRIEVGRRDGVKPGNIVGAVANEAGIDSEFIGPIKIHDEYSTIDLPEGLPKDIYKTLQNTWVAGKQLRLSDSIGVAGAGGSDDAYPRHRKRFGGDKGRPAAGRDKKPMARGKFDAGSKFKKRKTKS